MVIVNADIKTMTATDYPHGYVRIVHGKIKELGAMDTLVRCADEVCIDAAGRLLLPGFVEAHTHIGMWEDGLGFEGDDGNEDTDPTTPHLRAIDAVNPMDYAFSEAVDWGVTTVMTGPGSANPVSGQFCAIKTFGRCIDDMIVKEPAAIKFALGENPKTSYHSRSQTPVTRMATAAIIREQLFKAQKYLTQMQDAEEDEELDEPEYDAKCEALIPLLRGEIQAHFHAHRTDDIFTALRISKEFSLDTVIVHGTEGYLIADILAEQGARVICGPLIGARTKPELARARIENAAKLHEAGVPVAISTDHPEIPQNMLAVSAELAIRAGMDKTAALRAITIDAAQICGIADRVGSIEVGKDADLLIFDADPLTGAKPVMVMINGVNVRGIV